MRLRFPLVALVAVIAAVVATPTAGPVTSLAAPAELFVLAGQSNMLGRGFPLSDGEPSDSRLLLWRNGTWEVASDPLGDPKIKGNGIGPGMTFGLETLQNQPATTIGLVMCAIGRTKIADWLAAARPYKHCLEEIAAANVPVAGVLFLQGEADARSKAQAPLWSHRFAQMATTIRADLGLLVPVVIGQIGKMPETRYRYQDTVRSQQADASAANVEAPLVVTYDLPVRGGGPHFTVPSYKEIGRRFADAWWQATSGGSPPPPAPTFSVDPSSPVVSVRQLGSADTTVAYEPLNGFTGTVSLSVRGLPSGATADFSPASFSDAGTSTLTVHADEHTKVGTYTITITGTSDLLTRSTTATLVVLPPPPDFAFRVGEKSVGVDFGRASTARFKLTVTSRFGYAGTVSFDVSALPPDTTGVFAPPDLTLVADRKDRSIFSLTTAPTTPVGTYPLTITVTDGAITHTVDTQLVVR
jgi:hypothetical protein